METSGVYKIENLINKKCYIGSSKNIYRRIDFHRSALKNKKHQNTYLQNAVNKYGIDNFEVTILEECPEEELTRREQFWVNSSKSDYNITKEVIRNTPSLESRRKHSETKKVLYAEGKLDHIKKKSNPINQYDLKGNFLKRWESISEASEELNLSPSGIYRCAGKMYKTAHKYIWKYCNDDSNLNLDFSSKPVFKNSRSSIVILTNIKTGEKLIFESIKLACIHFNTYPQYFRQYFDKKLNFKKTYKIDLVKSDEFRETPEVDNPEPSL